MGERKPKKEKLIEPIFATMEEVVKLFFVILATNGFCWLTGCCRAARKAVSKAGQGVSNLALRLC